MGSQTLRLVCSDARFDACVTPFCFGDLAGGERDEFELHLMTCDVCWREVRRLSTGVHVLSTTDRTLRRLRTPEVIGEFGMSGHLDQPFAGHVCVALTVAILYGLLHAASVWTELGYSYDKYATLAWWLSGFAFASAASALTIALWVVGGNGLGGYSRDLSVSSAVVLVGLGVMTFAICWLLPRSPTIEANFVTRSAASGFLKNELLYFLPLLIFILPPFHGIVAVQRELRLGQFEAVLEFINAGPAGLPPRGAWLIPSWVLAVVVLLAALIGYQGTNHLLDNLRPGPYSGLFSAILYFRVFLWYSVALTCLAWYQRALQELKREAVAASRLIGRKNQPPPTRT